MMYQVSDSFVEAMKTRPYVARLTLGDQSTIRGDAIQDIVFRGGTNSETDKFALGGAVAATVEITLNRLRVPTITHGEKIKVELGLELTGSVEWIPMGNFYVTEPVADDEKLTVRACDALGSKMDREYEPLQGFDFETDEGVNSKIFLEALCERRGVTVNAQGLDSLTLKTAPEGFTERQIVGFIAALYGGFAHVDRFGVLQICMFQKTAKKVTADDYYDSGLVKAEYTYTVQWIKCFNEITELTMILGDTTAKQGIYLESIWMNNVILTNIWNKLCNFSYTPVPEISFLGDPRIDVGDIIMVEDMSGATIQIPVITITHEYDGGIITKVTADGQAETEDQPGAMNSRLKRAAIQAKTYSGISLEEAKKYTDNLDLALDQLEVLKRLTNETDDAIYMTEEGKLAIKATAILTGVLDAALITVKNLVADSIVSGVLKSKDGNAYFDLDNAVIATQNEYFSTEVTKGQVSCKYKGTEGARLMAGNNEGILRLGAVDISGDESDLNITAAIDYGNGVSFMNSKARWAWLENHGYVLTAYQGS